MKTTIEMATSSDAAVSRKDPPQANKDNANASKTPA
jgi:hypothetical protein